MPEDKKSLPPDSGQPGGEIEASHSEVDKNEGLGTADAPDILETKSLAAPVSKPEVIAENPRHIIRQGMFIIIVFFFIFGAWACIGKIHGAVVGMGIIKIENERKIVQHLEGGIIDEILVREGEEVKEGQPLILLQSVNVDANANMLQKQILDLEAKRHRLEAEKDKLGALDWPEAFKSMAAEINALDVLANEEKIFLSRNKTLTTQVELYKSQLAQLDAQVKGIDNQIRAEVRIIAALNDELNSKRRLLKEKYVDKSQILQLERELANHEGVRGRLQQSRFESVQKGGELELRIVELEERFTEGVIKEIGDTVNELTQTRERLRPMVDARERLQIVAPVAGKIVDLQVHSKGGVISPGQTLMDIVPLNQPMIVETQIPVDKITDVYLGQDARIQLDAFDTRFEPHITGKVTYISADRLENAGMPYYLCYVEVDPKSLDESDLYIAPGMPATVFIMTKERTVIYYAFEPLVKSWMQALRD